MNNLPEVGMYVQVREDSEWMNYRYTDDGSVIETSLSGMVGRVSKLSIIGVSVYAYVSFFKLESTLIASIDVRELYPDFTENQIELSLAFKKSKNKTLQNQFLNFYSRTDVVTVEIRDQWLFDYLKEASPAETVHWEDHWELYADVEKMYRWLIEEDLEYEDSSQPISILRTPSIEGPKSLENYESFFQTILKIQNMEEIEYAWLVLL